MFAGSFSSVRKLLVEIISLLGFLCISFMSETLVFIYSFMNVFRQPFNVIITRILSSDSFDMLLWCLFGYKLPQTS